MHRFQVFFTSAIQLVANALHFSQPSSTPPPPNLPPTLHNDTLLLRAALCRQQYLTNAHIRFTWVQRSDVFTIHPHLRVERARTTDLFSENILHGNTDDFCRFSVSSGNVCYAAAALPSCWDAFGLLAGAHLVGVFLCVGGSRVSCVRVAVW